jgi:hypothetical protein
MKKIKIMLLSLLVLGAVGAAVAFKTQNVYKCGFSSTSCPTPTPNLKIVNPANAIQGLFCTDGTDVTNCAFSVTTDN